MQDSALRCRHHSDRYYRKPSLLRRRPVIVSVHRIGEHAFYIADLSWKEPPLVLCIVWYLNKVRSVQWEGVRVDSWGVQQGCVSEVAERHSRTGKVPKSAWGLFWERAVLPERWRTRTCPV